MALLVQVAHALHCNFAEAAYDRRIQDSAKFMAQLIQIWPELTVAWSKAGGQTETDWQPPQISSLLAGPEGAEFRDRPLAAPAPPSTTAWRQQWHPLASSRHYWQHDTSWRQTSNVDGQPRHSQWSVSSCTQTSLLSRTLSPKVITVAWAAI